MKLVGMVTAVVFHPHSIRIWSRTPAPEVRKHINSYPVSKVALNTYPEQNLILGISISQNIQDTALGKPLEVNED